VIYAWFRHLPTSTRFSGLLLHQSVDRAGGFLSAPERHDLVGQDGVATTDLRPSGTATFGEERVDVVADGEYIPAGTRIRVVRAEGYRQVVRRTGA
jgi:membrane-bound serine protease (ClpP class)